MIPALLLLILAAAGPSAASPAPSQDLNEATRDEATKDPPPNPPPRDQAGQDMPDEDEAGGNPASAFVTGQDTTGGTEAGQNTAQPTPRVPPAPGIEGTRALVTAISPVIEEIRGLRFKQQVSVALADDATARKYFEGRLKIEWPESRIRLEQAAYADLGLIPRKTGLKDSVLDALEEQAGGYYDPNLNTFVVLSDMPGSMAPVIVAHELTHALDDQHYHIDGMLDKADGDTERAGGVAAVVEGSGTLVMTLFMIRDMASGQMTADTAKDLQQSEAGQAKRLKASPQVVQRLLVAPYVLGMSFLLQGGFKSLPKDTVPKGDLERAFNDPPVSWEQVLHPEKYWDPRKKDLPRAVRLTDLSTRLGDGWALQGDGELGEMILAILTAPGTEKFDPTSFEDPQRWTNAGAAGWGGDRWQLYRKGDDTVTVLSTLWDTDRDAKEFRDALSSRSGLVIRKKKDAVVVVAGAMGTRGSDLARQTLRALARQ